MGQKVHPVGFRLGYIYDWQSKWYSDRNYPALLKEDIGIRRSIFEMLPDAGIARVEIERNANHVTIAIHTSRPGIVIGRSGARVDELRNRLESLTKRRVRVNITEIRVPEIDAQLVARSVADQIERRISHRRAIKQAVSRAMQRGAQGIRIKVAGRLGGSEMSRRDQAMEGRIPLHTLRAQIDYGTAEARTTLGRIGVKCWVYKGDSLLEAVVRTAPEGRTERGAAPAVAGDQAAQPETTETAIEAQPPVAVATEPEPEVEGNAAT